MVPALLAEWGIIAPMESSPTNPSSLTKASRLTAAQRKTLREAVAGMEAAGSNVTSIALVAAAATLLSLEVTEPFAAITLKNFGYFKTTDREPFIDSSGAASTTPIWSTAAARRPLTQAERATILTARLETLVESLIDEAMEDREISFAELDEKCLELTRVFADQLGKAIRGRARVGATSLLPQCGSVALLAFKAAAAAT